MAETKIQRLRAALADAQTQKEVSGAAVGSQAGRVACSKGPAFRRAVYWRDEIMPRGRASACRGRGLRRKQALSSVQAAGQRLQVVLRIEA